MRTIGRIGPTLEIRDDHTITNALMAIMRTAVDSRSGFDETRECIDNCGYDAILVEHRDGIGTDHQADGRHIVAVLRWSWGREKTVRYSLYVATRNA